MVDGDTAGPLPDPPKTGWYPVPNEPGYQRFWNGQSWSSQRYWGLGAPEYEAAPPPAVAFAQTATSRDPGVPSAYAAPSQNEFGSGPPRRFYAITTIVGAPIFICVLTVIALAAIPTRSGRTVGIIAAIVAALLVVIFIRRPFVATARPDGSITFRALLGSRQTTVSRISRIWIRTSGRGYSVVFEFDGTRALLADLGGSALARYVVERNPRVDAPARWRQ